MAELLYINLVPPTEREAFVEKLKSVASALSVDPNWLLQVMRSESGLNPNAQNWQGVGNKRHLVAIGLIQFTSDTAKGLGTTQAALSNMTRLQQLTYVQKYFQPYAGRMKNYPDVYAVTFFPAIIGKPDNWVLRTSKLSAEIIAKQNGVIDINRDGQITVAEFKQYVYNTVPDRFKNILFNGDNRISTPPENTVPAETVFVSGIGDVEFIADETYVTYPSTIPVEQPGGSNPKEFIYRQDASGIAKSAIQENYSEKDSKELLENLGPSLNPKPGPFANVTIPFGITRSFDFFGAKYTVIAQVSSFVKGLFADKKKSLEFARENVLSPQFFREVPIQTSTALTVTEIREKLSESNVTDPELFEINDVKELVEKIKEKGISIFDKESPLEELATLIDEENETAEELAFTQIDLQSCPDGIVVLPKFQSIEAEKVAEQCCEPATEENVELEVPIIEPPELLTEEDILDFVANIDIAAENLNTCSTQKGEASFQLEKLRKVQEDLYQLKFFLEKRKSFLEEYKSGTLTDFKLFTPADILSLTKIIKSFTLSSFLSNNVLLPADGHYTNQSGVISKPTEKYFLIVQDNAALFAELKAIFEMYNPGGAFSDFVLSSEDLPKTLKDTQPPKGILYSKFYEKFNSAERVDFLFTATEQGYLSEKPTPAELLTPEGEEKVKNLKIDEEKSIAFLRTYFTEEKIRANKKLEDIKSDPYFSSLESYAKEQAALAFGIFRALPPLGVQLVDKIKKEAEAVLSFAEELDKKAKRLERAIEEAESCIQQRVAEIESTVPPSPEENVPPPGNDPFGAIPPSPFMPGPTKNKYWKEYTKGLQTVSLMPIPDVKYLTKRLFRYYPVGLQIDVPTPPKMLPTLASGIPDMKISIPFPIVWKHLTSLSTPAGQFVLWLAYCAPYTVSLYLMFIDESLNIVFLSSAKGKVEVPAKSLKWDDDSLLAKSVMERIPALKIPMKDLPAVDNKNSNKTPDDSKNAVQELQSRIKAKIDHLDSNSRSFSQERIADRTMLRKYREKLAKSVDTDSGQIDIPVVKDMLKDVQSMVSKKALAMLEFEPFKIPRTQKKAMGSPTLLEFKNVIEKAKSLKNGGALVETKTINIEKIFTQKALSVLDTPYGKKMANELDKELQDVKRKLESEGKYDSVELAEERLKILAKKIANVLSKSANKITNKTLGYVEVPINLVPSFLPEPARNLIAVEPMPVWMPIVTSALKSSVNIFTSSTIENVFVKTIMSQANILDRLPQSKDLLSMGVIAAVQSVLDSAEIKKLVPLPGWPKEISYPSVNMMKQAVKDAKNAIWKIKIRPPGGGIPQITVGPALVKKAVAPILDASINLIFANVLQRFSLSEQNANASISLQQTLQFTRTIFGNDIWDLNEEDVKQLAANFVRDALIQANEEISKVTEKIDSAKKTFDTIMKKLAPFSKQKTEKKDEPSLDIGGAVASSLFKSFIAKYASGEKVAPPYPVVLLGCATGLPGWTLFTKVNPFAAIDKIPPYERLSLKNVPHVIFLDMIAATAQRYGGIGSNYVTPYFVADS